MNTDNCFKITIFGDICPVADTMRGFVSGNPAEIMSADLLALLKDSDLTLGNMECVLTDNPHPAKKAGPVLHAPTSCLKTLSEAGFKAFSLANNHIRDCGSAGVDDTIRACKAAGFATFGAGRNNNEAKKPYIFEFKGKKIAFISFAEYEFNAVSDTTSGAALLDVYEDFDRIRSLRSSVDYLAVLYHGGIEYHPYPSPLLQKRCRAMVRSGADLVLCQHSHCIGSYEEYNTATILYGQGNNLFGHRANNHSWNTGLIVELQYAEDRFSVNFLPCVTNSDSTLVMLSGKDADNVMSDLRCRSEKITDAEFINREWSAFCSNAESLYMPLAYGWNRYLIFINRKLKGRLLKWIYRQRKRNITHNLIRCESHHEVMRTILSKYDFQ